MSSLISCNYPRCPFGAAHGPGLSQRINGPRLCTVRSAEHSIVQPAGADFARTVVAHYTPFDANTWTLKMSKSGVTVLCDPWFVDTLTFASQTWFFEGTKPTLKQNDFDWGRIVDEADFILLSQSLDDHTHIPTLKQLRKDIPVVASPDAARVAAELGFKRVVELDHGQQVAVCNGEVVIRAVKGALVGPPWSKRQNAYLLTERDGISVFYEPHASFDVASVKAVAPVDVVIVPTTSTYASGYPLVEGLEGVPGLVQLLTPKTLVPLKNNEIEYKGLLAQALSSSGSNDPSVVQDWLRSQGCPSVQVAGPQQFGEEVDIAI